MHFMDRIWEVQPIFGEGEGPDPDKHIPNIGDKRTLYASGKGGRKLSATELNFMFFTKC